MTHSIIATKDTATVTLAVTAAELHRIKRALEAALYLLDLDCEYDALSQGHRYVAARLYGVALEAEAQIHIQSLAEQSMEIWRTGKLPADPDTPPGAPRFPYDNGNGNNCN